MSEKKPRGRPPKNKIWDIKTNSWIQKEIVVNELKQNDNLIPCLMIISMS